jgi:hypothetical protein
MSIDLSPTQVVAGLGVGLALLMVFGSGARRGRRAADAASGASRLGSLAGYLLGTAGVIVGVQWWAITYAPGSMLFWVALIVPALITAHALTRSVTSLESGYRRGWGDR